jgi:hypothetical protein
MTLLLVSSEAQASPKLIVSKQISEAVRTQKFVAHSAYPFGFAIRVLS